MKSRITIEIDFENGNLPVIQILHKDSDDVRDRLVSQFLQSLQHTSRWCKVTYSGEFQTYGEQTEVRKWVISPIVPNEIKLEMDLMRVTIDDNPRKGPEFSLPS